GAALPGRPGESRALRGGPLRRATGHHRRSGGTDGDRPGSEPGGRGHRGRGHAPRRRHARRLRGLPRPGGPSLDMNRARGRALALVATALASIAIVLALPRIPQDPAYHQLADRRPWLGIPNALNVLSNAAFAVVGVAGLVALFRPGVVRFQVGRERWAYACFF